MFYLACLLISYLGLNAAVMLIAPDTWFRLVPGVAETGGFNAHFITDIGFIYLLAGAAILWNLIDPVRGRSASIVATGFLGLHAAFHLYESLFSGHHHLHLFTDIFGIYLPALLAILTCTATPISIPVWCQNLLRPLAHREISRFENAWDYDAGYMHDIADADLEAIGRFSLLEELGNFRKSIPTTAWYTVKLLSCIREDCGPCTQLVTQMAEQEGVPPDTLAAVLEGRREDLDEVSRLFYDYAHAVLDHDLHSEDLRRAIVQRFGHASVVSAGLSMITGKAYPLMKYALGHGQHCVRVSVAGTPKRVRKPSPVSVELAS